MLIAAVEQEEVKFPFQIRQPYDHKLAVLFAFLGASGIISSRVLSVARRGFRTDDTHDDIVILPIWGIIVGRFDGFQELRYCEQCLALQRPCDNTVLYVS